VAAIAGSTILGYAALGRGRPLEPFAYREPDLGDGEVRVAVTHCGLCYTDIHAVDDHFGVFEFPLVPGHEIVGRVSEVGPSVSGLVVGDRVGIGWQGRCCGECEWCRAGEEHLCRDIADCGTWTPYGGFSSAVAVDARFAYPLPATMAAETAAVLMCAGLAVYPPLRRHAADAPRQVGVVGVGGLGHLAIQFAHALGNEVTALSSSPGKEEEARALGADHFILSTDDSAMGSVGFGFDLLLCTAHSGLDWQRLIMTLKKKGRLVLVAFPRVSVDALDVVVHQLSITGSFLGSRSDMHEMLAFAQQHGISPRTEAMPMSRVNEAVLRVRRNQARYRVVLVAE
jgi:uncharacterized zinc-type alcohol dehydrogenase-like protein